MKVSGITMRQLRVTLLILLLGIGGVDALLRAAGSDGFPLLRTYSVEEMGNAEGNWTALQTPDGILFFGRDGLTTFDGDRWRNWPMDGATVLRALDRGSDGRIWAGAIGEIGWFAAEPDGSWKYHSLRSHLPAGHANVGDVWSCFAEGNGAVFVTQDKVLRWDGEKFAVWTLPDPRRINAMRSGGVIYVHHRASGLYALHDTGPVKVISAEVLGQAGVMWVEIQGAAWRLATSRGLFTFDGEQLRPFAEDVSAYVRRHALTSVQPLRDGRLALGTLSGGIVIAGLDGSLERTLGPSEGLPSSAIYGLLQDNEGNLWALSPSHVVRISLQLPTVVFDRRAGLPEQQIVSIGRFDQKIYVGSDNSVYALSEDNRHFEASPVLRGRAWHMRPTPEGLLVTSSFATSRINGAEPATVYRNKLDVFALAPSSLRPTEWYVSEGRNILATDARFTEPRIVAHDLPDMATSMAEDSSGHLWIGTTSRGVLVAGPSLPQPATAESPARWGIPEFAGQAFTTATSTGAVIVLSSAGGWFKPAGQPAFDRIAGFPIGGMVCATQPESDAELWSAVVRDNGHSVRVGRISLRETHAIWEPHAIEGLPAIGIPRSMLAVKDDHGRTELWIGGTTALLRHIVSHGPSAPTPPAPLLRASARDSQTAALAPITDALPYFTGAIEFEFALPIFAGRDSIKLESQIDGVDAGWLPASVDSRRELTALRDGQYRLRVRAVAETGVAGPEVEFPFEILPPWWRTPAAIFAGLGALLPFGYGLYRLRLNTLKRRNALLEAKVLERTDELERASAAKTEFVANMSHDIRNPLNGIVGLTLALEETRLDSNQRDLVATLRECTTYLSSLVDDVLDFASIEAGKVELRNAPFTPGELLNSVVTTLKADTAECGAAIYVEVDPALPAHISGDAGRVQQILVNYVSNALKYAGGDIHVSASIPTDAPNEIEFAVTDHGRGISEEEQATLFTKFTRLPGARQADITGAGLGLASCRLLADIMSGSVGVESRLGHGARFYVRLPLTAAAPLETANGDLPNTTVLLVEDTDYNAMAAAAVLRRLGLACERARTGEEALRLFNAKRFNIVLLDRNLPDMDGLEVARRMRQLETDGLQAIILAVTAYCTAKDKQLCLDAGMDAFVGKPLTPEKLRKVLLAAGRRLLAGSTLDVSHEPVPHPQTTATSAPALDTSLLQYLSNGSEQAFEQQVDRFLTDLAAAWRGVDRTHADHDLIALATSAHRVLGHARMVNALALIDVTEQLETAARAGDEVACVALVRRVGHEVTAVTEAMRRRRSSAATG